MGCIVDSSSIFCKGDTKRNVAEYLDAISKRISDSVRDRMLEKGLDPKSWEYWYSMDGSSGFNCVQYSKDIVNEMKVLQEYGAVGYVLVYNVYDHHVVITRYEFFKGYILTYNQSGKDSVLVDIINGKE